MSATRADVIVVGGGPAGAAAAYDLAAAGLSVVVLDRKAFPRPKPCAGALTIKALRRLRFSVAPVVRFVARDLQVCDRLEKARVFAGPHPIAVMTVRKDLDVFCLRQAIDRGARFDVIDDLAGLTETAEGVRLETGDGRVFEAAFVIGADGANSRVRRLLGRTPAARALALEAHVPVGAARAAALMRFDFNAVPGGYGWVFPKGDHLNVGLYSQRPGMTFTKADLAAYARRVLGTDQMEEAVGFPLGVGGEAFRQTSPRVLLAGDAAGTAERLLGEGLHNAILSGQLAAAAIIAGFQRGADAAALYRRALRGIQSDLVACTVAADWYYRAGDLGYAALAAWPVRTSLMRGMAAGKTFRDTVLTSPWALFHRAPPVETIQRFETG